MPTTLRAIIGDETGLLKLVDVASKAASSYGQQSRHSGIKGLVWTIQNKEFFLVRVNGSLEYYLIIGNNELVLQDSVQIELGGGDVVGLVSNQEGIVAAYTSIGTISRYSLGRNGKIERVADDMTVRGPLSAVTYNGQQLATGGLENDVQLWDLNKSEVTWSAKNVPHDFLSLRVPVWVSAISFMRTNDTYSEHELVTGTGFKHVRLYDVRAKRQPVHTMDIRDFRVTSLAPHIDGRSVFVGDTSGGFNLWDVRSCSRSVVLPGATGSVRHCTVHPYGLTVATVSLDRFLRMYDCTRKYKPISSVYLKNRINTCILFDDFVSGSGHGFCDADEDSADNESNADDVVEEINCFGSSSDDSSVGDKKKRKINSRTEPRKLDQTSDSEAAIASDSEDAFSETSDVSLVFDGGNIDDDAGLCGNFRNDRKGRTQGALKRTGRGASGGMKRGRGGGRR